MKIALIYTSYEGQTEKIMTKIQSYMGPEFQCNKIKLMENVPLDLSCYDGIILGSSIRYGFYHKNIKHFIQHNSAKLETIPNAFFGINLIARKPNKNTPETNSYTRKFLSQLTWKPQLTAVFAGALRYPSYQWYDRLMIRFIMWLGKGETDTRKSYVEYTDWDQVQAFASQFKALCHSNVNRCSEHEPMTTA